MTCCGCTLAGWTVTAVVLGLLESILGLSWNILVIVVMSQDNPVSSNTTTENTMKPLPSDDFVNATDTSSNDTDYYMSSARNVDYNTLWENLTSNLKTDPDMHEYRAFELVVTALVLNGLWLITTLGLAVGNAEKCRDMLKPWIGATVIITVTDIAATVYFIFGAIKRDEDFDLQTSFFTNINIFFAVLFSRGGIIIWIINIALCVFVAQRVKEIEVSKSKRMPFDSDFRIMSYPPYDAYETQSSTRTSKNFRPHTPPPDYEANGKKRRPSFSSENETMTLPISMASSRTSRPLSQSSYIYDDRVELQHRASCAAETVLHAYDNKGLVMETDGWMGIPRPSLKSNHH